MFTPALEAEKLTRHSRSSLGVASTEMSSFGVGIDHVMGKFIRGRFQLAAEQENRHQRHDFCAYKVTPRTKELSHRQRNGMQQDLSVYYQTPAKTDRG
ncbi:hypothetical protein RRF57_008509 [Xylaria bambusicola]|uniref:Uncharacterized protein n=1 Tax=Xylaria bambusicola TaxID=326684 RepID=A0AAN7Z0S3_9PEZI